MKLFKRLFYILLCAFIVGTVVVCVVESSSVWSRIATGLITGSFVGLVNTLTNYFHARQEYFEKTVMSLIDVEFNLSDDYIQAKSRNEFIAEMSKDQIIEYAAKQEKVKSTIAASEKMRKRYQGIASQFDFAAYVPLIPGTRKGTVRVLEALESLISFDLVQLYGDYRSCFDFTLISAPVSKEEQLLCIGDPEEFFDYVVQKNKDYQDLIAYDLNSLADLTESLSSKMSGILSKTHKDILSHLPSQIRNIYLKDSVIRDVRSERAAEVEKEWGDQADDADVPEEKRV